MSGSQVSSNLVHQQDDTVVGWARSAALAFATLVIPSTLGCSQNDNTREQVEQSAESERIRGELFSQALKSDSIRSRAANVVRLLGDVNDSLVVAHENLTSLYPNTEGLGVKSLDKLKQRHQQVEIRTEQLLPTLYGIAEKLGACADFIATQPGAAQSFENLYALLSREILSDSMMTNGLSEDSRASRQHTARTVTEWSGNPAYNPLCEIALELRGTANFFRIKADQLREDLKAQGDVLSEGQVDNANRGYLIIRDLLTNRLDLNFAAAEVRGHRSSLEGYLLPERDPFQDPNSPHNLKSRFLRFQSDSPEEVEHQLDLYNEALARRRYERPRLRFAAEKPPTPDELRIIVEQARENARKLLEEK